ncbi:MAG: hypothetical protein A2017_04340 [Lentisphaerae bacterium GWF2_44_16]|nr:MAG: hypothetical protein A2017_04340 [Lentisphaerae bacterium GWF2_44_16]
MKMENRELFRGFKIRAYWKFTMVELMVVISIIMILASLLFPALKKSKEKAYEIKCKGNFRQIGFATGDYTGDYNGWLPFGYAEGDNFSGYAGTSIGAWYTLLAPFFRIPVYDFYRLGVTSTGINSPCVFTCPSQKVSYPCTYPVTYAPSSRAAVGVLLNSSPILYRANLNKINKPSEKAWLVDVNSLPAYMNPNNIGTGNNFSMCHSKGSNILFFDFHTGWISYEKASVDLQDKCIFYSYY